MPKARPPAESLLVERRPISKLRPNPHNAKTHPEEQVRALAASIEQFGLPKVSIVVDERDVLLAGHGMRLGLIEARPGGAEIVEVDVMVARGWSAAKKRAFLEADNRLSELSGWDEDKRRRELQWLLDQGFPLLAIGWERGLADFVAAGAAPEQFPTFGADLETERQCPKCGFQFSGGKVPKPEPKPKKKGK